MKYTKELLEQHVPFVTSNAELARRLGLSPTGSNTTNLSRRCRQHNIDTSHFTGSAHRRGKIAQTKLSPDQVFLRTSWGGSRISSRILKRALLEVGIPEQCAGANCSVGTMWNGMSMTLQVDHIDGNFENNSQHNLRLLCPNCHSQTPTWGRSNS